MRLRDEMRTQVCSICGDHIGPHIDHTECAKIKQEMYRDEVKKRKASKKLTTRGADAFALHVRKYEYAQD